MIKAKITVKGQVTIPKEVRERLDNAFHSSLITHHFY
ncbi:MAG: AbrB/MazE/SpoVT family DNA-binding domain-containing protein [Candidatus Tectomicrobia bacterium]|nr:AbrB/MazE/SpoVT family DNA-binding domain-containing protein [Candidatus Tectomicrobia bacterium]